MGLSSIGYVIGTLAAAEEAGLGQLGPISTSENGEQLNIDFTFTPVKAAGFITLNSVVSESGVVFTEPERKCD